jgi:hypothetical protein
MNYANIAQYVYSRHTYKVSAALRTSTDLFTVKLAEDHFRTNFSSDYTTMIIHSLYHTCLPLTPFLDEPICHYFVTRAAATMHRTAFDIPCVRLMLSGLEAVACGLKKKIPSAARASFLGEPLKDIPDAVMEWGFPYFEYVQSMPGCAPEEWQDVRGSLGAVLKK